MPNSRTCVVSYRDTEGMEHSVEINAGSLYEAAALGLKAFRGSILTTARPGPATPLRVAVRAEESHEVRVRHLEAWLGSSGKSPREQALKGELRKLLGLDALDASKPQAPACGH